MAKNQNNEKKPFYKKWWVWCIAVIILFAFINGANDNGEDTQDEGNNTEETQDDTVNEGEDTQVADDNNNTDTTGDTNADDDGQAEPTVQVTEAPEQTNTRDNSAAKLTELNTGSFMVGTDIPKGRYVITGDGSGNLFIYDSAGIPYINEILGGGDLGVETVTTDIAEGDKIEISGINKVTFTPAETKVSEATLTTGNWIVGIDILPGRYDAESSKGNGNFFVYDKNGIPVVNEILGGGDIGVEKVTIDLEEGNMISISGMNEVRFSKK